MWPVQDEASTEDSASSRGKILRGFADDPAQHDGIQSILIGAVRKQVLAGAGLPSSNTRSIKLQRLPIDG